MKAVLQGAAGKKLATLVTVPMMVTMLFAPSSPVKGKRIRRTILNDKNKK
jgi:hypothetical protein